MRTLQKQAFLIHIKPIKRTNLEITIITLFQMSSLKNNISTIIIIYLNVYTTTKTSMNKMTNMRVCTHKIVRTPTHAYTHARCLRVALSLSLSNTQTRIRDQRCI